MERLYSQYFTALHRRELSIVRNLVLKEGCSVNHQFGDSSFPVHIAAEQGYLDVLKFLIVANASVNMKNRHGQTALLLGIGHPKITEALISAGAVVNLSDPQRRTALHLACAKGLNHTVNALIDAGSRVGSLDKWGRTPLHITLMNITHNQCVTQGFLSVVSVLLLKGSHINLGDKHHSTPLFLAVAAGDGCLEIIKMLLRYGANPDQPSQHKLTPLMLSVMKGYEQVCMLLLSQNCDVNKHIAATKHSCLRTAVRKGYLKLAELIVAAGCNLREELWLYKKWELAIQHQNERTLNWLHELSSIVPSLRQLCRNQIRHSHGTKLGTFMDQIHYPQLLKKYILLKDLIPDNISNL